ncbi:hypothetical protein PENFLA_c027G05765 [Penicillium flavigenum]|uniref:Uncharacterized protein n=1 Tax=Penicillium flavigenum TaxID=254877 RepID=A0A1V6SRB9_9EURO|nr:hypothetical protein PENFLA_c027G05765 [Penicillium flavigenum]
MRCLVTISTLRRTECHEYERPSWITAAAEGACFSVADLEEHHFFPTDVNGAMMGMLHQPVANNVGDATLPSTSPTPSPLITGASSLVVNWLRENFLKLSERAIQGQKSLVLRLHATREMEEEETLAMETSKAGPL